MAIFFTIRAGLIVAEAVMPNAEADLFREHVKKGGGGFADTVAQVHGIELTPGKIPREQNLS